MSKSIYFAGELFSSKHLLGNAVLAEQIEVASKNRYSCVLPQALEQREVTAKSIRDQDYEALLSCDAALFNFDGTELDSGTVAEFMAAKFADIPSVVIRTDFRDGGDGGDDPWNLMLSYYPRTKVIVFDGMTLYKKEIQEDRTQTEAVLASLRKMAQDIVLGFDEVLASSEVLEEAERLESLELLKRTLGLY